MPESHDSQSPDLPPRRPIGRGINRRELLVAGTGAAALALARRVTGQAAGQAASRSSPPGGLVLRNARALDAEAPVAALAAYETAPAHFFVRSHFGAPQQLPLAWRLDIDGDVAAPVSFTLDEIRRMPSASHVVTLECAGNGRGVFELPKTSGVQWERGAVSTATWTGVPLAALLERARPGAAAQHFWMEALDHAPLPTVPKFLRSIPRAVALGDAFVAFEMNGRPIPLLHGGPLRLIVPGWFGMASTKWLRAIHARPVESDNFFMAHGYRYADNVPVTTMRVKSVIASPLDGARVPVGRLAAQGQAWTGADGGGGIRSVELSTDGGRSWLPAQLTGPDHPGAWRSWRGEVPVASAGPQTLMARATDRSGAVQPLAATPNPGGYGNNSIHQVRFDAVHA